MIVERELVDLYVNQRWPSRRVAAHFNVNKSSVLRRLKRLGVERTHAKRKFEMRKKVQLTRFQKELVWGTMLGDGHIACHGKLARLMISHCKRQYELSKWKADQLAPISLGLRHKVDRRTGFEYFEFSTITHIEFKVLRDKFYRNSVKVVPEEIAMWLTPLALAVWIMDDGGLSHGTNLRLQTDSFTEEENRRLLDAIKVNFNANGDVKQYTRHGKVFCYLSFNKRNSLILSDIVRNFVTPTMRYKLIPRSPTTTCETSTP